jgi:hypothetical protein
MASDNLPATLPMDAKGVRLDSLEDAYRYAKSVIDSGNAPAGVTRPQQVMLSIQAGAELGFTPSRSLAQIPVINGRASLMGDAALALVRQSGLMDHGLKVEHAGTGDEYGCTVTSHRAGTDEPVSHAFTIKHAKQAKLWGHAGPWSSYPDRMLYYRALGFHLRDLYGDVLNGLAISEEVRDYPRGSAPRDTTPPLQTDPLLEQAETGCPDTNPATTDEPPDDWVGREE